MDVKVVSEKIENVSKIYAKKFDIKRDGDWFVLKLQEELGELIQSYLMMTSRGRDKGKSESEIKADFSKEIADVFSHVLLLAKHFDIDLEKEIEDKWLSWDK